MSAGIKQKDPAGINNFTLDWSKQLTAIGGLTIVSSPAPVWTVPVGITQVAASNTATSTTIRLSGGTHGVDYEILCHVTLSDGQEEENSLVIQVRQEEAGASADATDRANALTVLNDLVEMDAAPLLTENEIETILDRCRLARTWSASTAYGIGDVIVPPVRDGHSYECVRAGTSDTTTFVYPGWPIRTGGLVGESDTLIWQEIGTDVFNSGIAGNERNTYDINKAAKMCWEKKARKASQMVTDGDISFDQLGKNCIAEAGKFYPFRRPIQLIRC